MFLLIVRSINLHRTMNKNYKKYHTNSHLRGIPTIFQVRKKALKLSILDQFLSMISICELKLSEIMCSCNFHDF